MKSCMQSNYARLLQNHGLYHPSCGVAAIGLLQRLQSQPMTKDERVSSSKKAAGASSMGVLIRAQPASLLGMMSGEEWNRRMGQLALASCGDPIVDAVRHKLRASVEDDPICASVAHKLAARSKAGQLKYGTKLTRDDLTQRDWLIHAQEEALDLANYLEVLIQRARSAHTTFDEMQEQALTMACELQILIQEATA